MRGRHETGGRWREKGRAIGVLLLGGLLIMVMTAAAQEEDQATVRAALASRAEGLLLARCAVCHSPDLITQQRLPPARWAATVEKMHHWGAELATEDAAVLVQYLSARYHLGAPEHLPPVERAGQKAEPVTQDSAVARSVTGIAARGERLFAHHCQACHGVGATGGMGPKLAKNSILKHEDVFWNTVLQGRGPMPAWGSMLSHQDIADVHAWLLSQ